MSSAPHVKLTPIGGIIWVPLFEGFPEREAFSDLETGVVVHRCQCAKGNWNITAMRGNLVLGHVTVNHCTQWGTPIEAMIAYTDAALNPDFIESILDARSYPSRSA